MQHTGGRKRRIGLGIKRAAIIHMDNALILFHRKDPTPLPEECATTGHDSARNSRASKSHKKRDLTIMKGESTDRRKACLRRESPNCLGTHRWSRGS